MRNLSLRLGQRALVAESGTNQKSSELNPVSLLLSRPKHTLCHKEHRWQMSSESACFCHCSSSSIQLLSSKLEGELMRTCWYLVSVGSIFFPFSLPLTLIQGSIISYPVIITAFSLIASHPL